jgi:hypothetical protein
MSCSGRLQVCHGYCVKSVGDNPGLPCQVPPIHQECMAGGSWESKVVAKNNVVSRGSSGDRRSSGKTKSGQAALFADRSHAFRSTAASSAPLNDPQLT